MKKRIQEKIEKNSKVIAIIQLGKNGYSDSFVNELEEQLQKNKVIKLRILKNAPFDDRNQAFDFIKKNLPRSVKMSEIKGWTAILTKVKR
ncbi:MAG: YhbY family RNA-binding protein [Candidatus Hodarchaeales archaeon]